MYLQSQIKLVELETILTKLSAELFKSWQFVIEFLLIDCSFLYCCCQRTNFSTAAFNALKFSPNCSVIFSLKSFNNS